MSTPPPPAAPSARSPWAVLFALDLRSLAVFRVCLGLVLLVDLLLRARSLAAHYTDAGLVPVAELSVSGFSSLHALAGAAWLQWLLFAVAAVAAVALVLGYRTRAAVFFSFVLLLSLHNRNPLVLHGGDDLLRLLLFWSLFLPLGARWSLDRRLGSEPPPGDSAVSVATAGFVLQLCFLYWFSVLHKSDPVWWRDGTAVYYTLSLESFTTPLGRYLLTWPDGVLRCATFATLALEVAGPLLLFVPAFNGWLRTLAVVLFVGFHVLGLGLAIELGIFPYVCAAAWLALLPGSFWAAWGRTRESAAETPWAHQGAGLNLAALAALLFVLAWNVYTTDRDRHGVWFGPALRSAGSSLGLAQCWNLFAPRPMTSDGWFVVVGTRDDGSRIDPFRGQAVNWDKPALVSATYRDERWRKYLMNLLYADHEEQRPRFARYLYHDWNARHPAAPLRHVAVYFILEPTPPPGGPDANEKVLLAVWPPVVSPAVPAVVEFGTASPVP